LGLFWLEFGGNVPLTDTETAHHLPKTLTPCQKSYMNLSSLRNSVLSEADRRNAEVIVAVLREQTTPSVFDRKTDGTDEAVTRYIAEGCPNANDYGEFYRLPDLDI
jgi:hypothetical protein